VSALFFWPLKLLREWKQKYQIETGSWIHGSTIFNFTQVPYHKKKNSQTNKANSYTNQTQSIPVNGWDALN
jgi:hypothetical protein